MVLAVEPKHLLTVSLRFFLVVAICCELGSNGAMGIEAGADSAGIRPLPAINENTPVDPAAFYNLFSDDTKQLGTAERLEKLEAGYSELQTNYDELSDDYSALKKRMKHLVSSGTSGSTMRVVGRIHLDHWGFPNSSPAINVFENNDPAVTPQDRIGFRRVRFGVRGDLWKTMVYRIEMEFSGGDESEFRDVFIGWKDIPVLHTLLVGNQKRPYGLDHLNSSRYNVFIERPFVIESFNQDARRMGIQSYGVSEKQDWNWRYGVFNQRLIQDEGSYISDHYQLEFAGRLANTFWYDKISDGRGYGHWALSGTIANPDANGGVNGRDTNEARFRHRPEARSVNRWLDTGIIDDATNYGLLGVENVWNFGPLQFVGEYQNLWLGRSNNPDVRFHGGYAYVSYFLTGEHIPWDRKTGILGRVKPIENFFLVNTDKDGVRGGWGAWQIAYRYSYADFTDDNIYGGIGRSHTLGFNWHWNPYARMQFNAIYGEIDSHEGFDAGGASLGVLSGNYTIVGTRLMVDF